MYILTYDNDGNEEEFLLPSSIAEEFSILQGLDLRELTNNDFLSKLEIELEKYGCCLRNEDGKVERRSFEIRDFLYEFTSDGKRLILTKFRGEDTDQNFATTVKRAYNGFPVERIGQDAFALCESLSSIVIEDGIEFIDESAFSACANLNSVMLPKSVRHIGYGAFCYCKKITEITIKSGVSSIGGESFMGCTTLKSIHLPEGLRNIGRKAFIGCNSLTSVSIPTSVEVIEEMAFENSGLTSVIIPRHVNRIDNNAFRECKKLVSVKIDSGVTRIGKGMFEYCVSLNSIEIPDTVTCIEAAAFSGCTNLLSITIPKSVDTIGRGVFSRCSKLQRIDISIDNEHFTSIDGVLFSKDGKKLVAYPNGCSGDYSIPEHVEYICDAAFKDCNGLTRITIPNGVLEIGNAAFMYCSSLTSIILPESITSIGVMSFYGCSNLSSIAIPDSVIIIGNDAFDKLNHRGALVFCCKDTEAWHYCVQNSICCQCINKADYEVIVDVFSRIDKLQDGEITRYGFNVDESVRRDLRKIASDGRIDYVVDFLDSMNTAINSENDSEADDYASESRLYSSEDSSTKTKHISIRLILLIIFIIFIIMAVVQFTGVSDIVGWIFSLVQ